MFKPPDLIRQEPHHGGLEEDGIESNDPAEFRMNPEDWATLSGFESLNDVIPRALPWASVDRAVGAPNLRPKRARQGSLGNSPVRCPRLVLGGPLALQWFVLTALTFP